MYTDGFVDGPMYDEGSALLRCPGCKRYCWQEDLPTLQSVRDFRFFGSSAADDTEPACAVDGQEYIRASRERVWNSISQEKYVRVRAWWAYNEEARGGQSRETALDVEFRLNLEALTKLFDTSEEGERVLCAEALRELGRFDDCIGLLEMPIPEGLSATIQIIKRLAHDGDASVALVTENG